MTFWQSRLDKGNKQKSSANSFWNDMGGGTVFISHSHKDLPKVRQIRNFLEKNGFDPLCFFMQCLSDEDEIDDLLKREIDAREWFAFMESPNSIQSAWVKKERDYILKNRDKKILYYRLQDNSPEQIANHIMDHMTVYVCYSEREKELGSFVAKSLRSMDFRVYDRCDHEANIDEIFSESYAEYTAEAIRDTAKHGCFLYLMTHLSSQALHMRKELEYALQYDACIAVASLGIRPWDLNSDLQYLVSRAAYAEIIGDKQESMIQIASLVGQALLDKDE